MLASRDKRRGCYHCNSSEHRGRDCPEVLCRLCGEQGHDLGGCPLRPLPKVDLGSFRSLFDNDKNHKENSLSTPTPTSILFTYAELFAGIGGFRVALDRLGGQCVFSSETDRFARSNYEANHGDRPAGDITRISIDSIPQHDVLVGGFPCQPFSSSGKRQGLEDDRGVLFLEIVKILKKEQKQRPKAFLLENVRGLLTHDNGCTLAIILKELKVCGYVVSYSLVDAVHLLPQERSRLFLVGIRKDLPLCSDYSFPTLPKVHRGVHSILQPCCIRSSANDALTATQLEALCLSEHQIRKVRSQPYTKRFPEARFLQDNSKPSKTLQSSYSRYMVGSQFVSTTAHSGWRRLSGREAARLQGFPEDFVLCSERPYQLLGNAVAPPIVTMVAVPLLCCIGVQIPEEFGRGQNAQRQWGWFLVKQLLLEATPNDERREELSILLESVNILQTD